MNNLPEMTVELRESTTAHGVPAPERSLQHLSNQLKEAWILNENAKESPGWRASTLDILKKYIPFPVTDNEIIDSVREVLGFTTWGEVSEFVVDDMCSEFFNLALRYCLKEGQPHDTEKGFIDGSGIGYLGKYKNSLKHVLEDCFDAKYFYKLERPLQHSINIGFDLTAFANAIHPGHWSYPQGHMTKFFQGVATLDQVFNLDKKCFKRLIIAALVGAQGRAGNLMHYLMDALASTHLIPELREKMLKIQ